MKRFGLQLFFAGGLLILLSYPAQSQSCIPTGIQGTTINLLCNQVCSTLVFQVPHIKSSDDYTLVTVPYAPYPYSTPTGSEDFNLYNDDQYSTLINLPFPFCFYGAIYNTTVVGSNGIMTFDPANASCSNNYVINNTIPWAGGAICAQASGYYPRASIMGAYSDLDPRTVASPANRKIQWEVIGTAPCRKFVVSYYRVGVFGNNACGQATPNTFQMVIHESTGIVEIFTEQKACASSTNTGRGVMGIQNWNQNQAIAIPGRNNTFWTDNNSGYRFIPSAGTSRYVISEILDFSGTVLATADTLTTTPGLLDIRYPNFCVPSGSGQYIVRTQFSACDNPANILTSMDTITINRLNSLGATATATVASCGPPDGIITVTVPPGVGTPPYTFVLDGGAPVTGTSPYTFNNVAAGPHTINVVDASGGCTSTVTITVTQSGTIPITTTNTPTACFGSNTGSITISSAGGIGPYTFSLDGGAPVSGTIPFTFNNVSSGSHSILVTDLGSGCNSGPQSVTVGIGAGVNGTALTSPTACAAVSTGTITVNITVGTAPFSWQLDGGPVLPGANPYTFTSVSAGGHNVTVFDANNCSKIFPVTILSGTGVSGNGVATPTSCPGVNDGTLTITVFTGLPPYSFSLDGGAPVVGASPYTFTGLTPGVHNVLITDNVGCSLPISATVVAGTAPTAVVNTTATACTGVNNGTITVTSTTMAGPYTFSLDGGPAVPGALPYTFTNVPAGAHTVQVTGSGGCSTSPVPVTVAVGAGVNGNANTNATSCPTALNGSIIVNATAGTAPFTYTLDGGAPQSGTNPFTFNNVAAGTHSVVITDNFGCTFPINNIIVAAGPVLTANTSTNPTSCSGATNGSVTVTPVGGAAPFTFSLDGGAPVAGTPPFTFNNVPAGTHSVIVTDAAGCVTNPISVTVVAGPSLTTTATVTDVLCNGGNTGTITVTVPVIGTAPYQYSLDGTTWQASNVFSGLVANTYTVYYRESNGCQGQHTETVNEPAALATTKTETAVSCNGGNDGVINISVSGGTTPYQYSIDGGSNWQPGNTFTVVAGSYTITIRDANGCITTQSATITEPAVLTAASVNVAASCNGGNDGTITVTANGGNTGYQYSLDGTNYQSSNIFNVAPGTYTVWVKDNLGCSTSFSATVGLSSNLTLTPQTDPVICEGSSTQLNLASNATIYVWTPSTGLSNPNIANPVASPTVTTQYIVQATLDRCSGADTVIVNVNTAPVPDAGPGGQICYGQTFQLQGSGGVQYAWTPATYLSSPSVPNPVAAAAQTTTYTLSIISDVNGCPSLVTDDVTVDVTPPIKIYTFPNDTIAYPGDQIQFKAVPTVSNANIFSWSPFINLDNPFISTPTYTAGNVGDSLVYKVTASSAAGCIGEAYVKVRVYKGPELYTPTAFTPNGDGLNDKFYPFPVGIKAINYFRVYNRWGQLVFSSNVLYQGWDGTFQGVKQASGVYVYMAQGVDKNNKLLNRQGSVTLIR